MSITIKKGPQEDPPRLFIYGQEGIGKTTLAASIPGALTLTAEDGAGDLQYDRAEIFDWPGLRNAVRQLTGDAQGYRAIVIDSATAAERLLHAMLCEEAGASGIEDLGGGFGKGYTQAGEAWSALLRDLDVLRTRQRVAVVIIGHSEVRTFADPTGPSYDRYQPRLDKKAAAVIMQWADVVAFAGWDTTVRTAKRSANVLDKGKAEKAVRRLYLAKEPAFDAKSRYQVPDELPVDAAQLLKALDWEAREQRWRAPLAPKKGVGDAFAELGLDLDLVDAYCVEQLGGPLAQLNRADAGKLYKRVQAEPELRARLVKAPVAATPAAPEAR